MRSWDSIIGCDSKNLGFARAFGRCPNQERLKSSKRPIHAWHRGQCIGWPPRRKNGPRRALSSPPASLVAMHPRCVLVDADLESGGWHVYDSLIREDAISIHFLGYHHLEIDLFQQCHDSWIFVNFDGTPHGTGPRGGTFGLLWCGCAAGFSARTGNWSWWFSSFWGVNIWLYQRIPTMTQLAGIGFDHWTRVCYCRHDCRFHKPPIVPDQIFHGAWFTPIIQLRFWTTLFFT